MEKAKEAAVSDKAARQRGLGVHGMLLCIGLSLYSRNLRCSIDIFCLAAGQVLQNQKRQW